MAICLEYQQVYQRNIKIGHKLRWQIAAASVLLAVLAAKVWLKIETTDLGYELAKERQRTIALDMQRRELELQLSVLTKPDYLAKLANQKLGLRALKPNQAVKISAPIIKS